MSKILQRGETGFGILIEQDAGYISKDLNTNLLTEGVLDIQGIKVGEPILINCILQKWGVENKNGRIYPKEVLVPQVQEYEQIVKNNSAVSEADHPDCQLPDSEILTKDGWKKLSDISDNEEIQTLNIKTNKIETQKIEKKIYEDYSGEMFEFKSRNFENTVTPNHRFLLEDNKGVRFYITAQEIYDDVGNILSSGKNKILKQDDNENTKLVWLNKKTVKIKKIEYNGKISCVHVENSNFYTRVNGKAHWTGNSSVVSLHNIAHLIRKMWWGKGDNENILYGQLELAVSPGFLKFGIASMVGDKILVYLGMGIRLGISSRGVGTLEEINGKNIVQDDFELICFDLVASPSTPGAFLFPEKNELEISNSFDESFKLKGMSLNEQKKKISNAIDKFLL